MLVSNQNLYPSWELATHLDTYVKSTVVLAATVPKVAQVVQLACTIISRPHGYEPGAPQGGGGQWLRGKRLHSDGINNNVQSTSDHSILREAPAV